MSSIIENEKAKKSQDRITLEKLISGAETFWVISELADFASPLMADPDIHNLFFERIHFLKNNSNSKREIQLLEQIEKGIEAFVHKEFSDEAPAWLVHIMGGKRELQ